MKKRFIAMAATGLAATGFFAVSFISEPPAENENFITLREFEREPYINLRGWEVTEIKCEEITVPQSFEGVYETYARVQEEEGLPLEKYKGKKVTRCLYQVENYGGENEVLAELLLSGDTLIAAALIENSPDGFIKSLDP